MKIIIITLTIILIILSISIIFLTINQITGKVIEPIKEDSKKIRTYTKNLCNESNFCQDYIISCWNNQTIEIKPANSSLDPFSINWSKTESKEIIRNLCK